MTDKAAPWPSVDAPGRYRAQCSCGLSREGTARELAHFQRLHSDPPRNTHVVSIAAPRPAQQ